jgi:hypothetical protein
MRKMPKKLQTCFTTTTKSYLLHFLKSFGQNPKYFWPGKSCNLGQLPKQTKFAFSTMSSICYCLKPRIPHGNTLWITILCIKYIVEIVNNDLRRENWILSACNPLVGLEVMGFPPFHLCGPSDFLVGFITGKPELGVLRFRMDCNKRKTL